MLRLVGSEPPKATSKRRKGERTPVLSEDEEKRFRAAMRGLRDAFGTWGALSAAMGADSGAVYTMMSGKHRVSGDMIVRAMRASGLTLNDLLGAPTLAGRCRACGAVKVAS